MQIVHDVQELDLSEWLFLTVVSFIAGAALFLMVMAFSANGRVDFCRINMHESGMYYRVVAHIPWRLDDVLARTHTMTEAVEAARQVNCPVEVK